MSESTLTVNLTKAKTIIDDSDEEAGQAESLDWKPSLHEWLILITLSLISMMISIDATILVTTLGAIVVDLEMTTIEGFWTGTSYLLSCAVIMPFVASLSDIFGRSISLITSLGFFTTGSLVCCLAQNGTTMLIGRVIQGMGGSGVIILSLVILTDIVPLRFRPKYVGVIQGGWALGTCIGPISGGLLIKHANWRWIFYIMFPFCFIGFITIPWLLTIKPRTDTLKNKLRRVDWFGGVLFISSITSFLIAISWGGVQQPWSSYKTLLPLLLGVAGIAASIFWEAKKAVEPFLNPSLFYCRSAYAVYFGAMCQGLLLYGQLYYAPFYFMSVKGYTPIRTGISLFPVLVTLIPAAVIVGIFISRLNSFRGAIWAGWVITTAGTGLTILFDRNTSTAIWAVILVVLGIGHGLLLNAQNFATQAICKPRQEGAAAAMYAFLRSFGMAVGVSIGGSVFQNVLAAKLRRLGLPEEIAYDAESYVVTLHALPDGSEYKETVLGAYAHGFQGLFTCFCAIAAAAGLASLFIKHYDLNRNLESEHTLEDTAWPLPMGSRSSQVSRVPTPDSLAKRDSL